MIAVERYRCAGRWRSASRLARARARAILCCTMFELFEAGRATSIYFGLREELVRQLLDHRRHRRGKQQASGAAAGSFEQIVSISGMNPMSSMRSGLVDHQQIAAVKHGSCRARTRSISRPGVAISTSTPSCSAFDLIAHLHAADQQRHFKIVVAASTSRSSRRLARPVPRWLEDQRARHQRTAAAMRQNVDHRQHEAGRLARPRLRDADKVAHHRRRGDRLRLDGGRGVVARVENRLEQLVRQAELANFMRYFPKAAKEADDRGGCRKARLAPWRREPAPRPQCVRKVKESGRVRVRFER